MIKLSYILKESSETRDITKRVSKEINLTQAIDLIKQNCTEAVSLFNDSTTIGEGLYRGYGNDKHCFFTEPKTRERTGTNNLYNALITILPAWKDFPPRSNSLMFSNNSGVARTYGTPYWLFPFDGANIAHCEQRDCWYSFKYADLRFGKQGMAIDSMMNHFAGMVAESVLQTRLKKDTRSKWISKAGRHFTDREYTVANAQSFLKELQRITPFVIKHCRNVVDVTGERHDITFPICDDILKNFKGDWTQYFDDLLNPEKNNMKRITVQECENIGVYVELWTDAKCIMVNPTADVGFYANGDRSVCGTFFKKNIQSAIGTGNLHLYGVKV